MALTYSQRTALDTSINSAISNIPNLVQNLNGTYSKNWQIKDVNEFVYGHVIGTISNSFHNIIFVSEGRMATREETQEAEAVILQRLAEIRNAIALERYYHLSR